MKDNVGSFEIKKKTWAVYLYIHTKPGQFVRNKAMVIGSHSFFSPKSRLSGCGSVVVRHRVQFFFRPLIGP